MIPIFRRSFALSARNAHPSHLLSKQCVYFDEPLTLLNGPLSPSQRLSGSGLFEPKGALGVGSNFAEVVRDGLGHTGEEAHARQQQLQQQKREKGVQQFSAGRLVPVHGVVPVFPAGTH